MPYAGKVNDGNIIIVSEIGTPSMVSLGRRNKGGCTSWKKRRCIIAPSRRVFTPLRWFLSLGRFFSLAFFCSSIFFVSASFSFDFFFPSSFSSLFFSSAFFFSASFPSVLLSKVLLGATLGEEELRDGDKAGWPTRLVRGEGATNISSVGFFLRSIMFILTTRVTLS